MKLEPNKTYKITKGNTDGSIMTGDSLYLDGKSGMLIVPKAKGWLERDELTPSVMDFECIPIY